jgi:hypothetical protein
MIVHPHSSSHLAKMARFVQLVGKSITSLLSSSQSSKPLSVRTNLVAQGQA